MMAPELAIGLAMGVTLLWLGLGMLGAQALPGFAVASREARQRV